jgi:hypothetical protein
MRRYLLECINLAILNATEKAISFDTNQRFCHPVKGSASDDAPFLIYDRNIVATSVIGMKT